MSDPTLVLSNPRNRLRLLWPYALMVLASMLANWFIQLGYYFYATRANPLVFHGERTLLDYSTGFIGDLIVVPLMNAAILYMLLKLRPTLGRSHYMWLAICGVAADALLHFSQGFLKLANWSMPAPYDWDFAGYWHMVSFFFQISFVFLFVYLATQAVLRKDSEALRAMCVVFALIGIFMTLFFYDYLPLHSIGTELAIQTHRAVQRL